MDVVVETVDVEKLDPGKIDDGKFDAGKVGVGVPVDVVLVGDSELSIVESELCSVDSPLDTDTSTLVELLISWELIEDVPNSADGLILPFELSIVATPTAIPTAKAAIPRAIQNSGTPQYCLFHFALFHRIFCSSGDLVSKNFSFVDGTTSGRFAPWSTSRPVPITTSIPSTE